eukprot:7194733-Karenia_brevis.AAC.1
MPMLTLFITMMLAMMLKMTAVMMMMTVMTQMWMKCYPEGAHLVCWRPATATMAQLPHGLSNPEICCREPSMGRSVPTARRNEKSSPSRHHEEKIFEIQGIDAGENVFLKGVIIIIIIIVAIIINVIIMIMR